MVFDVDGTIMTTKSGRRFQADEDDYKIIWKPSIPKSVDDMKVVTYIHTNQSGNLAAICDKKIEAASKLINADDAIIAREDDENRKPSPFGLLNMIYGEDNTKPKKGDIIIFIGDAAGRKDDHSDTDIKTAMNLKILGHRAYFTTPDEYPLINFKGVQEMILSLRNIRKKSSWTVTYPDLTLPQVNLFNVSDIPDKTDMILMCGIQGSGKSTIIEEFKNRRDWKVIRYTTKDKTLRDVKKYLSSSNVIVDGTFSTRETRKLFLAEASSPVIVYVDTPEDLAKHNRKYREIVLGEKKIPSITVSKFLKDFEVPTEKRDKCPVIVRRARVDNIDNIEYMLYYY